ncbi:Zn-ribbon domain-containing OB-fold protein [Caldimonas thermodepolymerans]|jgi:Predicted nucleic-acid-binding protein containing a Zn-ribbon|uniref:Zn-ribbon domain-containing OB-fold protein n=1 Tax=Caldimonas thermodepolymerans TaxID=215580 RepID=UPI002491DC63|nr:Zn-ribbon domain-containing OB-fold protein [Caldimonas thermodepolymerans]
MQDKATPGILGTEAYWQAASEGRLLIKRCRACGQAHFYPRDICPHCLSADTEWIESSGTGSLYSYSRVVRGSDDWTIAFVRLDEGVTMMSNVVDCDPAQLRVGLPVSVVFRPAAGGHVVPMFRPAEQV